MNVAILTPIQLEHKAILAYLGSQTERAVDGSRYVSGHYEGKHGAFNIVTQQTGSGNSTVALATEKVIRNFQPVVVILAGIAGGVKDVAIGDVVVGTKFYGYESGKETETGFVVRPEAGSYSKDLLATAQSVAANEQWREKVKGGVPGAKVIFGPIASGDKVIAATEGAIYRLLKQSFNDTTALEMESNGFGQAMQFHPGIRFANIRGISDLLEGKSHADASGSQERAAANMAAFIFELLDQLDGSQFKIMGMDLKELAKQMLETTLPITKMEAAGQDFSHTASESAVALWQQVKSLLSGEYPVLKNAPDDPDAKAEARIALRQALEGKAALQTELETLLREAQKSGSADVAISKNVIENSNIDVSGDFRTGDDYGARQENKSSDAIGGDKYVQSASQIHINHYYGKEEKATPGTAGKPLDGSPAPTDYIQNLQRLIASGRPEAAIQSVIDFTASRNKEANLEANTIADRWQALARKQRLGTIRNDDANIERSQIVGGLLDLVGRL